MCTEQLTIRSNLVHSRTKARHGAQDVCVDLPGIRLSSDGVRVRESEQLGNSLVQGFDLYISQSLYLSPDGVPCHGLH